MDDQFGQRSKWALCTVLLVGLALTLVPAPRVHAATLTVNTLLDDTTNGDGLCTLREAITAANNNADYNDCAATGYGDDTITFSVSGIITLSAQLPVITAAGGALTIDGAGQSVTISGNDAVRLFSVGAGATLNLQNLTLANGRASTGGGVRNGGTLQASNCIFASNVSTTTVMGLGGGAIYNDNHTTLMVSRSVFSDNRAAMAGGGIFVRAGGAVTITQSTFSGNSASGSGGISNDNGTMIVTGSTFSGNSATSGGGGIGNGGTLTVTNCTFSGNSAGTYGGGINNGRTLTVINSTFSGNSATTGGGIRNGGTATVYNTIIAGSTGGNCSGTITNGGNNLDDGATCGWGTNNGSMSNTDPQLGPLADNGGPTWTFALLAGSPAIDGVTYNPPNNCPATDQRGYARPVDGDRNGSALCDIGAFEYQGYFIYLPLILRGP